MFIRKLVTLLFALLVLLGCEEGSDAGATADFEATIRTTDKFGQSSTSFVQGDDITITLSVTNLSSKTKTLHFSSSKQYDLVVKSSDGLEVWRWSSDRVFVQVLTSYELAPGETRTFTYEWNQVVSADGTLIAAGSYTLEAVDIGIALVPRQELNII